MDAQLKVFLGPDVTLAVWGMALIIDGSTLRTEPNKLVSKPKSRIFGLANLLEGEAEEAKARTNVKSPNPNAAMLDKKLAAFEKALNAFDWPKQDFPWDNARLALQDEKTDSKLHADFMYGDDVHEEYKFFSKSVRKYDAHDLSEGTHSMTLKLGGRSETVSISVDSDDTYWLDIQKKLRDAVNDSTIPVQAEIIYQSAPGIKMDGLQKTGYSLALSVERPYDQDLELDERQSFARAMEFNDDHISITAPLTAATKQMHQLRGPTQAALPTSIFSSVLDPNQATSLELGQHSFNYEIGEHVGTLRMSVEEDDTWEDVLTKVTTAINNDQSYFTSEILDRPRIVYQAGRRIETEGIQLSVFATNPKVGERLTLSQGSAKTEAERYDPTTQLPVGEDGKVYLASATANGWTEGNVYTFGGTANSWVESTPAQGDVLYLSDLGMNYRYNGTNWEASDDALDEMGVEGAAYPGSDAKVMIDGVEKVAATGVFNVDKGRLILDMESALGETVPLNVVEGMQAVEGKMADVVGAYNDFRSFLVKNELLYEPGFANKWELPLNQRQTDLNWLGMEALGNNNLRYVNGETFWQSLTTDADRARNTLWTNSTAVQGLVPAWQSLANTVRAKGLDNFLATEQDYEDNTPWRAIFENEDEITLVDIIG